MKQLTIGDILEVVSNLKNTTDMTDEEVNALPVYIGNDDEMNGIHTAYYAESISDEENVEYVDLINSDCINVKFSGKAILIS